MKKALKIKLDKAQDAFDKFQKELAKAEDAFNNAPDEKAKDKAQKALSKLSEKETEVGNALAEAQEAYDNAPDDVENGKVLGNVDSSYEFNESESKYYHVKHSRMETLPSGVTIEDPGTVRIQKYGVKFIEDQIINKEMGLPSIWDIGETVKILHDPTK